MRGLPLFSTGNRWGGNSGSSCTISPTLTAVVLLVIPYLFLVYQSNPLSLSSPAALHSTMVIRPQDVNTTGDSNSNTNACPALQYATVNCPVWDSEAKDGGTGVDYRVKWIHQKQNPENCSDANFLIRALVPRIGFGANVMLSVESTMYVSNYADRIFLLDPTVPFRFASCEKKTWDCYFEPLSHCTIEDAEAIVASRGGEYDTMLFQPEHRVIRTQSVSQELTAISSNDNLGILCMLMWSLPFWVFQRPAEIPPNSPWGWNVRGNDHPWWANGFLYPGRVQRRSSSNGLIFHSMDGMLTSGWLVGRSTQVMKRF